MSTAIYQQGTASLGSDYAGLTGTIGYRLVGVDGSTAQPFTTAGVAETTVPGDYAVTLAGVRGLPLPATSWAGKIVWGTAGQDLAEEEVGPPPWFAASTITADGLDAVLSAAHGAGSWGVVLGTTPALTTTYPIAQTISGLARVYCTDEDIALRALSDYPTLASDSQILGAASDGVFAPENPWVLTSASVDFAAYGVHAGNVVWLTQPSTVFKTSQLLAVDSVTSGTVTLRRLGKPAGIGQPPVPAAGVTAVKFSIQTFDPQIDQASYDANRYWGIDPNRPGHTPDTLYDPRELQQYCVLHVLVRAYAIAVKSKDSSLDLRLQQLTREFEDLKQRTIVQWGKSGDGDFATTPLGARVRR